MNINTFVASTCPMIRGRFFCWMMGRNFRNIDTTSGMAWREVFWVCGKFLQRSQDLCFGGVPIYKTIKSRGRSLFGSFFLFERFVSFKSKGLLIAFPSWREFDDGQLLVLWIYLQYDTDIITLSYIIYHYFVCVFIFSHLITVFLYLYITTKSCITPLPFCPGYKGYIFASVFCPWNWADWFVVRPIGLKNSPNRLIWSCYSDLHWSLYIYSIKIYTPSKGRETDGKGCQNGKTPLEFKHHLLEGAGRSVYH